MVTIRDVAKKAGVSVATVSRVFNASGPVSDHAEQRVRAVAAKLRYVPHSGARSLITSKTNCVGVILPDLYGEFFSEVIRGMDQASQQHGFHLLLSNAHAGRRELEVAMRAMRGRVDGMIIMSPHLDAATLLANLPASVPVALLSGRMRGGDYDALVIDNSRGAQQMVSHLVSLGHRRIAIIGGAEGNYDAQERLRGYRRALREAGIACDEELEVQGDFTEASGHRATTAMVNSPAPPTAIFAANDSMAIGALSALYEAGIRVPQDVAVAGFDDIPLARFMNPPLSSVHVPIAEMGMRAAQRIIESVSNGVPAKRRREVLPTKLVIRASTGGPARITQ
jgi:LacI family transcriptional regulator